MEEICIGCGIIVSKSTKVTKVSTKYCKYCHDRKRKDQKRKTWIKYKDKYTATKKEKRDKLKKTYDLKCIMCSKEFVSNRERLTCCSECLDKYIYFSTRIIKRKRYRKNKHVRNYKKWTPNEDEIVMKEKSPIAAEILNLNISTIYSRRKYLKNLNK